MKITCNVWKPHCSDQDSICVILLPLLLVVKTTVLFIMWGRTQTQDTCFLMPNNCFIALVCRKCFFFFWGGVYSMWTFPDQELNLHHSRSDQAWSLVHWTNRGLQFCFCFFKYMHLYLKLFSDPEHFLLITLNRWSVLDLCWAFWLYMSLTEVFVSNWNNSHSSRTRRIPDAPLELLWNTYPELACSTSSSFLLFFIFNFYLFIYLLLFRAAPTAYGGSQPRGWIRAAAASL